jgi:DNA modification methylase
MKLEEVDINSIKPYKNNPREISKDAIEKVKKSIKEFGNNQPIVVDQDNIIVVGHTRYKALKGLNKKKAYIVKRDFEKGKAMAYRIMDNRSGQESDWDNKLLVSELNILKDNDLDLDLTGFNFKELDDLLKETEEAIKGLTDEDLVPPIPEKAITKIGDIWKLGNHRLLCGDATKEEDYKKLMNGYRADMVFTDPPYGLGYEYNSYEDVVGHEYLEFCDKWFPLLQKHTDFIFLTAGWKYNDYWIRKKPTDMFYWIARNKNSGGKLSYFRKIEPIFLFGKPKNKYDCDFFDFNNEYRTTDGSEKHTCPKPVKFVTEATKIIGNQKIVLDVFLGSGTTIIACEKNNNMCYGIELDPIYCDVIIKRWENYTGQKAEKL